MNNLFKKVVLAGLISGALSSFVFAESNKNNDLLHRLSNGEISDYSNGVELLNKEQREKVVGGFGISYGQKYYDDFIYSISNIYLMLLDQDEKYGHYIKDEYGRNNTHLYSLLNLMLFDNEYLGVRVIYERKTRKINAEAVIYNTSKRIYRAAYQNSPVVQTLLGKYKNPLIEYFKKEHL